jgi:predicted ABC-type sugar transport system permease subunit
VPSSVVLRGAAARRQVDRGRFALFAVRYGLFLALGLWMVAMTIASEHFLSWLNFLNVFRQAAPVVVVAVGMTLVMLPAGSFWGKGRITLRSLPAGLVGHRRRLATSMAHWHGTENPRGRS